MRQAFHSHIRLTPVRGSVVQSRVGVAVCSVLVVLLTLSAPATAQTATSETSTATPNDVLDVTNPISIMQHATRAAPWAGDTAAGDAAPGAGLSATLSIILLLTILSIAPSLLVMTTSFTRIVVVLALLRQAIGTQSLPPSQVIVGLALFMTFLVMAPTFDRINAEALTPLQDGTIDQIEAWRRAKQPLRQFMFDQIDYAQNWPDVEMILAYRQVEPDADGVFYKDQVDMLTLIPAFMLSELKVAFLMGFRLYLPFLIVDMVVASVLISMGMLMLPPVLISLPFKLMLFVLVDGWQLVVGSLLSSFSIPGVTT
ncbi:MAG: flagellar type III secretion system pore protein FliP [Phycisphaeraceae bacterium]